MSCHDKNLGNEGQFHPLVILRASPGEQSSCPGDGTSKAWGVNPRDDPLLPKAPEASRLPSGRPSSPVCSGLYVASSILAYVVTVVTKMGKYPCSLGPHILVDKTRQ